MIIPRAIIDYTNHRGERAIRIIMPLAIYYEQNNKWHGACYILRAFDYEKKKVREFDMRKIHSWRDG